MCGIAALFHRTHIPEANKLICQMTNIIRHRGPDDEGFVFFTSDSYEPKTTGGSDTPENVYRASISYCPKISLTEVPLKKVNAVLGHRRLSIVDLSPGGHQPMCSQDGRIWISYNGEIFNYLEIKQDLQKLGHFFCTNSDTEVILRAYEEWGEEAFHLFNGMFAFILYDQKQRKGIAVRDRFGVKPLYYWQSPCGLLAFASEIKQFQPLPGWRAKIHPQLTYDFLNWGMTDHTPETMFAGVNQLRGGESLKFSLDEIAHENLKPLKWYTLSPRVFKGDFYEASKAFYHLLEDAVRLRLRSDVDLGSCLSGGLDSSSIVCIANKLLSSSSKQKTFSACSEIKKFDERVFIEKIVGATGVKAHYIYPSLEELFEESQKIVWHQDEPFGSTSIYAQWEVFKMVKKNGVKVMLDGQGADELLGGYHGFFGNHFFDLFKSFKLKTLYSEIKKTSKLLEGSVPSLLLMNKLLPRALKNSARKFMGKASIRPCWMDWKSLKIQDRDPCALRNNNSFLDQSIEQILYTSLPKLLHYEDRDSMAHSVESRTPFLDYRLVEFSLGLISEYKINGGWTKRVLRESMKGILPEEIRLRRDKLGFVTAEEDWARRQSTQKFREHVNSAVELSGGILSNSCCDIFEEFILGKRKYDFLPWRWISFGHWVQKFSVDLSNNELRVEGCGK